MHSSGSGDCVKLYKCDPTAEQGVEFTTSLLPATPHSRAPSLPNIDPNADCNFSDRTPLPTYLPCSWLGGHGPIAAPPEALPTP